MSRTTVTTAATTENLCLSVDVAEDVGVAEGVGDVGVEGLKRSPAHVLGTFSHELQIPRPSHICLNTLIAIHSAMFE